jgi:ubiquinone/menaquinone biosynthesis C-methylase UbiE
MSESERIRAIWDKSAPRYDKQIAFFERKLFKDAREWVCSQARGKVLEIATGTGRNFPFYPDNVEIVATEFSPGMMDIARERAATLGLSVDLRLADAQALDFPDGSFDTVVCTLAMCNIPDYGKAIGEAHRVLKPGGTFLSFDHVASDRRSVRVGQRLLNPITVRFEGDHLLRDPEPKLTEAGFTIERLDRYGWGIVKRIRAIKAT